MTSDLTHKLEELVALLKSYGGVALGFSGGVDSTFLAAVSARFMPQSTTLVHLINPFAATPEQNSVRQLAHVEADGTKSVMGLPLIEIPLDTLSMPKVACNAPDRCYQCKLAGFSLLVAEARARGIQTVIDGSNADDVDDDRPGMRALRELGVRSPLQETGWHKSEERALLRSWDVPVWNLPAGACLATRVKTGEPLTSEKLNVARACEDYLHGLGLRQVRARIEDGSLRIEAAYEDLSRLEALATDGAEDVGAAPERRSSGSARDDRGVGLSPAILHELRRLSNRRVAARAVVYHPE